MKNWYTPRVVGIALVAASAAVIGGTAIGAVLADDAVKTFTGCLAQNDGMITKVKEGDAPKSACASGQTVVRISGGDMTSVNVQEGGGLTGGGTNGAVSLSLRRDCSAGQLVKWDGSAWTCATDSNSTYTAGTGLDLSGSQFSVASSYRVKNTPDCSSGEFATGFDSSGEIECGTPTAPTMQTFESRQVNFVDGDGIPDDGTYHTYVTLPVPAGKYLVNGKGRIVQGDDDQGFVDKEGVVCRLGQNTNEFFNSKLKDNEPDDYGFALTGIVNTTGQPITLECLAPNDIDLVDIRNGTLVALKVG